MSDAADSKRPASVAKALMGGRAAAPSTPPGAVRGALAKAAVVFGSFGMAVTLLLLLLVLTLLGTLEQQYSGLYDVQRKYFESFVLIHKFGPVPIPLPGATLVIALLSANLIVGGIIRLRKGKSTVGILIAHIGILILFAGGLVETRFSDKGQMMLWVGESSSEFQSYFEWEIAVVEHKAGGGATEYVLGHQHLDDLSADDVVRFTSDRLPFDVKVTGWARNARPRHVGRVAGSGDVEGWVIDPLAPEKEAERNVPGTYVTLVPPSAIWVGTPAPGVLDRRGILWGASEAPWVVTAAGRRFELTLRSRRWPLPFRIELKRFVHKEHPGTEMASEFSSYVTKREGGTEVDHHITMNEPLRHEGYTFYQSGWGPPTGEPDRALYSTFSVVKNPSDRVPIAACVVIAVGLLVHFRRKLFLHIRSESKAAKPPTGSPA